MPEGYLGVFLRLPVWSTWLIILRKRYMTVQGVCGKGGCFATPINHTVYSEMPWQGRPMFSHVSPGPIIIASLWGLFPSSPSPCISWLHPCHGDDRLSMMIWCPGVQRCVMNSNIPVPLPHHLSIIIFLLILVRKRMIRGWCLPPKWKRDTGMRNPPVIRFRQLHKDQLHQPT
jgi:hypothetical protein